MVERMYLLTMSKQYRQPVDMLGAGLHVLVDPNSSGSNNTVFDVPQNVSELRVAAEGAAAECRLPKKGTHSAKRRNEPGEGIL
jgi:hypothetical protein